MQIIYPDSMLKSSSRCYFGNLNPPDDNDDIEEKKKKKAHFLRNLQTYISIYMK